MEERIITSIGIELVVKLAKSIRSVIVVIKYSEFITERAASFKQLMKTLSKLFRDKSEVAFSTLFIITDTPIDITRANIIDMIDAEIKQEKLDGKKQWLEKFKAVKASKAKDEEMKGIIKRLEILELMRCHSDNVITIDVLGQKSRHEILTWLNDNRRISLREDSFNFTEQSFERVEFNGLIFSIVARGIHLYRHKIRIEESIWGYEEQVKIFRTKINAFENNLDIKTLQEMTVNELSKLESKIRELEILIGNVSLIEDSITSIQKLENKMTDIQKQLADIHAKTNIVLFKEDHVNEPRSMFWFLWPFGWTEKKFLFNNSKVPFKDVVVSQQNGKFIDTVDKRNDGYYSNTYQSSYNKIGIADALVYVEERHLPDNQERIKLLTEEFDQTNKALTKLRTMAKNNSVENFVDLQTEIKKLKEELATVQQQIKNEEAIFLAIGNIIKLMDLKQPLIIEFLDLQTQLTSQNQNIMN